MAGCSWSKRGPLIGSGRAAGGAFWAGPQQWRLVHGDAAPLRFPLSALHVDARSLGICAACGDGRTPHSALFSGCRFPSFPFFPFLSRPLAPSRQAQDGLVLGLLLRAIRCLQHCRRMA